METETKDTFVAFLDILGFQELITNNEVDTVALIFENISKATQTTRDQLLRNVQQMLESNPSLMDLVRREYVEANVDVVSISDSLVIWAHKKTAGNFYFLVLFLRNLLALFLATGVPLRGALTSGLISIVRNSTFGNEAYTQTNVFGKSIVDAYRIEGKQQWSGCVISKDCIEQVYELFFGPASHDLLLRTSTTVQYDVPFKDGAESMLAINWAVGFDSNQLGYQGNGIKHFFKMHNKSVDHPAVQKKITNTVRFFRYIHNIPEDGQ